MPMKQSPSEKAEERRRIREALAEEAGIQENLLNILQKQTREYERSESKLKDISLQSQIINVSQKKLQDITNQVGALENNILKRNQRIFDNKQKLNIIEQKNISARAASLVVGRKEENVMLSLSGMWKNIREWQEGKRSISKEELEIVKKAASIQGLTLSYFKNQAVHSREKTIQMMRQAEKQKIIRDMSEDVNKTLKEHIELNKKQSEQAKIQVKNWFESLSSVTRMRDVLNNGLVILKSMGIETKRFSFILETGFIIPLVGVVYVLKQAFSIFKEFDKAAWEARKAFGMMRDDHDVMRKQAETLAIQYAHLGLTAEMNYKTQVEITKELGNASVATDNLVSSVGLMNAQFGIGDETTVRMLKTLGQVGHTTAEAQLKMMGYTKSLANAAKVPLPAVMDDIAKASETTRLMFSRTPLELVKAAVEARRLGTTLDKMASSSRKLLNFSESITDEMEASVLIGKPINLQLARELAYRGKIEESNKNILDLAEKINFEKLDIYSAEAFAKASGKSADELRSMLQSRREQETIARRALTDKNLANELKKLEEMKQTNKAIAESEGERSLRIIQTQQNQERLVSISNSWKKILMDVSRIFLPIIDKTLLAVSYGMNFIEVLFSIGRAIGTVNTRFTMIGNTLKDVLLYPASVLRRMVMTIGKMTGMLRTSITVLKSIGKFTGILNILFATWNVIKSIYTGITRIVDVWKSGDGILKKIGMTFLEIGRMALGVFGGIIEGFFGFVVDIPILILKGLGTIGFEWAKKWGEMADSAWEALKDWFGFSPSKNALLIVNGLKAVGSMIFEVITSPFKLALSFLKTIVSGIGQFLFVDGLKAVGSMIFEAITNPFKMALDFIKTSISGIGQLFIGIGTTVFNTIISPFKKVWDWVGGMVGGIFGGNNLQPSVEKPIVSAKAATVAIPVDKSLPDKEIKSYNELNTIPAIETKGNAPVSTLKAEGEFNSDKINELLNTMKEIRDGLLGGKIAVNIDGQAVSVAINRTKKYRGEYGAMVS